MTAVEAPPVGGWLAGVAERHAAISNRDVVWWRDEIERCASHYYGCPARQLPPWLLTGVAEAMLDVGGSFVEEVAAELRRREEASMRARLGVARLDPPVPPQEAPSRRRWWRRRR